MVGKTPGFFQEMKGKIIFIKIFNSKTVQSDSLKEAMQKAGVISMPEVHFLEDAFKVSA